jgi:iron complex transport system ATP-binding protein
MTLLEFRDLTVQVGARTLLGALNLRVAPGEFVALIGPNGAGKTTLLKSALALRAPSQGSVLLGGEPVATLPAKVRAGMIAWLPQHIHADEPLTCLESVAAARFRFRETHAASLTFAAQALERVGAFAYAARAVTELSGGERQRVAFACLVAQEARILLCDEPANHLDPAQQLDAYRLLGELWREGRTVVCINHDVNLLHQVGDADSIRVVGLGSGGIVFDARLSDGALPRRVGDLFGLEMESLPGEKHRFIVPRRRSMP